MAQFLRNISILILNMKATSKKLKQQSLLLLFSLFLSYYFFLSFLLLLSLAVLLNFFLSKSFFLFIITPSLSLSLSLSLSSSLFHSKSLTFFFIYREAEIPSIQFWTHGSKKEGRGRGQESNETNFMIELSSRRQTRRRRRRTFSNWFCPYNSIDSSLMPGDGDRCRHKSIVTSVLLGLASSVRSKTSNSEVSMIVRS